MRARSLLPVPSVNTLVAGENIEAPVPTVRVPPVVLKSEIVVIPAITTPVLLRVTVPNPLWFVIEFTRITDDIMSFLVIY
jgi:hypothetical protein